MKAGIDLGSSLTKAVIFSSNDSVSPTYISVANADRDLFADKLVSLGVDEAFLTGIGSYDFPFKTHRADGDMILNEIQIQVEGTRKLLEMSGSHGKSNKGFGLCSIGTGTSYTFVFDTICEPMPIGSFIGGGFINGMMRAYLHYESITMLDRIASCYKYIPGVHTGIHIQAKDVMKESVGTSMGEMIIGALGKMNSCSAGEETAYAIFDMVAASTIKDVILYQVTGQWNPNKLVFIGSVVGKSQVLRDRLTYYAESIGLKAIFPENAGHAGAIGAAMRMGMK